MFDVQKYLSRNVALPLLYICALREYLLAHLGDPYTNDKL